MSNKCRAENEARCPYHGANYLTDKMFKKFQSEGWTDNVDDWKNSVKDILFCLTDKDFKRMELSPKEIAEQIDNGSLNKSWGRKDSSATGYYLPTELMIKEISYLLCDDKLRIMPNNALIAPDKAVGYRDKVDHKLALYMQKKAIAVDANENVYAWEDYESQQHVKKCGYSAIGNVKETNWHEFTDTFTSPEDDDYDDGLRYGVEAEAICNCGRFDGKIRCNEPLGNVLAWTMNN